jgi:hypothetical protein
MKLEKIAYSTLNPRQKEIFNFQKVSGLLADYGYNCIKLADDWQGADFLAFHVDGSNTLKVQLKSRMTISKKYIGKSIYMTFPINNYWYLIEHDSLVLTIESCTTWLNSDSWLNQGSYSSDKPNKKLIELLLSSRL